MKSLLILIGICGLLTACSDATPYQKENSRSLNNDVNLVAGSGGGGYSPCDRTYFVTIVTDSGVLEKEVPFYCNPNGDPYHGDPAPDYMHGVNPDTWSDPAHSNQFKMVQKP